MRLVPATATLSFSAGIQNYDADTVESGIAGICWKGRPFPDGGVGATSDATQHRPGCLHEFASREELDEFGIQTQSVGRLGGLTYILGCKVG